MDLKNRTALTTGAGVGIGWATAIELARYGCTIIPAEAPKQVRKYAPDSTSEVLSYW